MDSAGGSLESEDGVLTVVVPAGAVTTAVSFSITPADDAPGGHVGPAFLLGPADVAFDVPVQLWFERPDGQTGRLWVSRANEAAWSQLAASWMPDAARVIGLTTGFSVYALTDGEDCGCAVGEVCRDGACEEECTGDERCDPHHPTCWDGACPIDACDPGCEDGERCFHGACYATCDTGVDCPEGVPCLDGRCTTDACAEVDCGDGQTCHAGRCFAACALDTECVGAESCIGGRCVDQACDGVYCGSGTECYGGTCFPSADCAAQPDACGAGFACYFDGEGPSICLADVDPCDGVDCGANQSCYMGTCFDVCVDDDGCDSGSACWGDARCAVDVCDGVACHVGQTCHQGTCFAECASDLECENGEGCRTLEDASWCMNANDPCADVQCRADQVCFKGSCFEGCSDTAVCDEGNTCWDATRCAEQACDGVTCRVGQTCHRGTCFSECTVDADCGVDAFCWGDGRCAEDVCAGISCPADQVCYRGTCFVSLCVDDEDCDAAQVCLTVDDDFSYCQQEDDLCAGIECATAEVCTDGVCGLPCMPGVAASVVVGPGSATAEIGDAVSFEATVYDDCGSMMEVASIAWTTTDACVATVDEHGMATAVGGGASIVRATGGGVSGTATLTVANAPAGDAPLRGVWKVCTLAGAHVFTANLVHEDGASTLSGSVVRTWGSTHTINGTWNGSVFSFNWDELVQGGARTFSVFEGAKVDTSRMSGRHNDRRALSTYDVKFVRLPIP